MALGNLTISATDQTPAINFNASTGILAIYGRSIEDEASVFFEPVHKWLKEYAKKPQPSTELTITLEYIDVASSREIFDILAALEDIKGAKVVWCYKEENGEMEETGEEFSELVRMPFELKPL